MTTKIIATALVVALFLCASAAAQTTAFTYQGSLKDGASPANGNYDLEFKLFDLVSAGAQQGSTIQRLNVAVANGIFTVSLDFGAGTLPGADRYLDIGVRPTGGGAFTPLSPRQKVNSSPYSVKSLNAATADSVAAAGIPAGSGNYIQNGMSQQTASNFNISGTGRANILSAATQYNIGTDRILYNTVNENISVGSGAGAGGTGNVFFGKSAGQSNTSGDGNSFVGWFAGQANTGAVYNSFFGARTGFLNTTGNFNSFVGYRTGESNNGSVNSFFGTGAGLNNINGNSNTFVGHDSGNANLSGSFNTAIGESSNVGNNLTNATAIGSKATVFQSNSIVLGSINGVNGATANTLVGIGTTTPGFKLQVVDPLNAGFRVQTNITGGTVASFGGNGAFRIDTQSTPGGRLSVLENGNIGIGTATPNYKFHVVGGDVRIEGNTTSVFPKFSLNFTGAGADAKKWQNYATSNGLMFATLNDAETSEALWLSVTRSGGNVSQVSFPSGDIVVFNKLLVGLSSSPDQLAVGGTVSLLLAGGGSSQLCQNATNQISTCSSSLRYKKNISGFDAGMSYINKLRPISFDWKDGGMKDVGFGAEDIAKIDPRFVTYNDKGEVEGVKYDRLSVAFVNAFKEQQTQIETLQRTNSQQQIVAESQQRQNDELRKQVDALKTVVCSIKPDAEICKTKEK